MKFAYGFLRLSLTFLCAMLVVSPLLTAENTANNTDSYDVPPSVLHQQLWEGKARSILDDGFVRKLNARMSLDDTQSNYDMQFYDVFIRVNDTTEILYGHVRFVALAAQDGVSEVQVDFGATMSIDSIVAPSGDLAYTRSGDVVTVTLDRSYDTGEQFEFVFGYHGHPIEGGFQAFSFDWRSGVRVISSLSEPYFARTWWPCKDRMDDKPDSMDIAIQVDTDFYVASNGTLTSVVANGGHSHTYHYEVRYPMTTYLFSVAISNYTVWEQEYLYNDDTDTMPIVHAVYPDLYGLSQATWGKTPEYMEVLSREFGEYPFIEEKYGHANFEWGGGMEHQTMTSMGGGSGFGWSIIVHELGHSWWGDMITCESWQDIWLNEGWASYSEAVYYLDKYGWNSYRNYMDNMAYSGGGTIYVSDTTSVGSIFHGGLSYDKGAWVVHMLRGYLGEDLFADGVAAYYSSEHKYGSATTEDFKNVWEGATGVELDEFFDNWIHGQYRPNYHFYNAYEPSDSGGYDVYIVIKQIQSTVPTTFTMPVDVLLEFETIPDDTVICFDDERKKLFKFHYDDYPRNAVLDPGEWILKYVTNRDWQVFVTTLDGELSEGFAGAPYLDTVQTFGGSGNYSFLILEGELPPGLSIDDAGHITGTPTDTGTYTFDVHVYDNVEFFSDQVTLTMHVDTYLCCGEFSEGYTGNINRSTDGLITLADITALIDHVYVSKAELDCAEDGNVNGSEDGRVTLSDITRLIDHVYISKLPTALCPQ